MSKRQLLSKRDRKGLRFIGSLIGQHVETDSGRGIIIGYTLLGPGAEYLLFHDMSFTVHYGTVRQRTYDLYRGGWVYRECTLSELVQLNPKIPFEKNLGL